MTSNQYLSICGRSFFFVGRFVFALLLRFYLDTKNETCKMTHDPETPQAVYLFILMHIHMHTQLTTDRRPAKTHTHTQKRRHLHRKTDRETERELRVIISIQQHKQQQQQQNMNTTAHNDPRILLNPRHIYLVRIYNAICIYTIHI